MIEEHERWASVESKKRIPEDAADTRAAVAHGGLMTAYSITTGDVKLVTMRSVGRKDTACCNCMTIVGVAICAG